ncbi:MAG: TlpA family protein disulfide reductase [Burkholderiales bacterium]|nr:TlpA family protein disulfide reductase [Burkholderiales bacterium]
MKLALKPLLIAAVIVALVGGYIATLAAKPAAPAVVFVSLNGEKVALESLRGKVVLVNFWATDCPGCIAEMPDLVKTHRKYQPAGLETVAVAMSYDPPNYVLAYTQKNALPFIVSLDPTGSLSKAFKDVKLTPTTFVIDKQGRILQRVVGVLDFAKLHALIEKELRAS